MRNVLHRALLLLVVLLALGGCSAKQAINEAAAQANRESLAIRAEVGTIHDDVQAGLALLDAPIFSDEDMRAVLQRIDATATSIDSHAVVLVDLSSLIQKKVIKVEDVMPAWMRLIRLALWVAGGFLVIFVLWRIGALVLFEKLGQKIVDFFGWVIGAL